MKSLKITSPAFEHEGWIPNEYSGFGEDISPELYISDIPQNTKSLLITLDDLDHPIRPGYNHWIAWNIPPVSVIEKGIPRGEKVNASMHIEQGLAYGKHCYRGPKPPFNWKHRYVFTIYALDCILSIAANSTKGDALKAISGHITAQGNLLGKYQRKHL